MGFSEPVQRIDSHKVVFPGESVPETLGWVEEASGFEEEWQVQRA